MRVHPGIYWSFYFLFLAHSCLEKKVSSHCEKCVSTFPRASWPSLLPGHAVADLRGGIEFPRRPARKSRRRISHRVFRAKSPDREGERPPRLSPPPSFPPSRKPISGLIVPKLLGRGAVPASCSVRQGSLEPRRRGTEKGARV